LASTPTIWFNDYLSSTAQVLEHLQQMRGPGEMRLLCTHRRRHYRGARFSDAFEVEPREPSDEEYLDYCEDVIRRYRVDLFVPWRKLLPILQAQPRWEALGVRVLAPANAATVADLFSKARQYERLASAGVPLPDYRVVNTVAEFDRAVTELRRRHDILCCKPAASIYGLGFYILTEHRQQPRWRQTPPALLRSWSEARQHLAQQERFADLMVMQHLPGPERSIDCLAQHGQLLRCIVRRKSSADGFQQRIEKNDRAVEIARRITAHLGLHALFNIQLRDKGGVPYLLEINPRMSGGLPAAFSCGLALPYWAIRLALGTATVDEIPQPRTGLDIDTSDMGGSL
jgi:carbamoylphosphate synthase large subunit